MRAQGEGSIYYSDSRQRWVARWQNKTRYRKTKKAAAAVLAELKTATDRSQLQLATVGDVVNWWTTEHLPHRVTIGSLAPKSLLAYRDAAAHTRPIWKHNVEALTSAHVDRVTHQMGNSGAAASTVKGTLTALRQALKDAHRKGLCVATAAAQNAEMPASETTPVIVVTPEIAAAVLDQLNPSFCRPVVVALSLGLRIAETLGLVWDDIDMDAATIRIHRQLRHAQVGTTLRYAHVAPEVRRRSADRIDGMLG